MPTPDARPADRPSNRPLRVAAIVCAAGSGTRFGRSGEGKLDADLHGKPVLIRAVEALAWHPCVGEILVAGPADPVAMRAFRARHERALRELGASLCAGGVQERYQTVQNALARLLARGEGRPCDAVLVHDAARPCTPAAVVDAVIAALGEHGAVVPAVPLADTLRRCRPGPMDPHLDAGLDGPLSGLVAGGPSATGAPIGPSLGTVERTHLYACQTPQGFGVGLLERAYAQRDLRSTDDAELVERLGEPVVLVAGDRRNIKITHRPDLDLARLFWPTLNTPGRPRAGECGSGGRGTGASA